MMPTTTTARELYRTVREGHWAWLHRCTGCWLVQAYADASGLRTAVDNGFHPADRPYPHARWCPCRGTF